jgi:hypothetical protein
MPEPIAQLHLLFITDARLLKSRHASESVPLVECQHFCTFVLVLRRLPVLVLVLELKSIRVRVPFH